MDFKEAIKVIKNNYPPENYTMLREALDLAMNVLEGNVDVTVDVRDENLEFISYHISNGEGVHQISFTKTNIVLNDKQIERLRG